MTYEIVGALDARAAEAVRIEVRRLAERFGVAIRTVRIEERDAWWTGTPRASPARVQRPRARR